MNASVMVVGAIIFIEGLISFATGKCLFYKKEKYTEESLSKLARPHGVITMLSAVFLVLSLYLLQQMFDGKVSGALTGASFIVLVIILIAGVVIPRKILVRK